MQYDAQVLIQAYYWTAIYDRQHEGNVKLKTDLALTNAELKRAQDQYTDAFWALHELSNGAANAAIRLYTAGQLQERIAYETRNRIQARLRLWAAEAKTDRSDASRH
jgi:hypothetical protein